MGSFFSDVQVSIVFCIAIGKRKSIKDPGLAARPGRGFGISLAGKNLLKLSCFWINAGNVSAGTIVTYQTGSYGVSVVDCNLTESEKSVHFPQDSA